MTYIYLQLALIFVFNLLTLLVALAVLGKVTAGFASTGSAKQLEAIKLELDTLMSQLDDLTAALGRIGTGVDEVGTDVGTLVTELQAQAANPPAQVDLSGAITQANAIADKLNTVRDAAVAAAAPPSPPTTTDGDAA